MFLSGIQCFLQYWLKQKDSGFPLEDCGNDNINQGIFGQMFNDEFPMFFDI